MSDLHLGVTLPLGGVPDVRDAARQAEACGLDGVWAGDHLVTTAPVLDSAMSLTAAAAVTERITVGWAVMLLALRQQAWAAKQIASLQHLSGGRVQLGVGVGGVGVPNEWNAAGVASHSRGARTDAMLTDLPDLLAGHATPLGAEAGTPTVKLDPATAMPPLWIGGTSDAALNRAITHGAGWLAAMLPPDALAARAHDLAALAHAHGRAAPPIGTVIFAAPTPEPDPSAVDRVLDVLHGRYGMDPAHARAIAIAGCPDQLADGLTTYQAAGATTFVIVPFSEDILAAYQTLGRTRTLLAQR